MPTRGAWAWVQVNEDAPSGPSLVDHRGRPLSQPQPPRSYGFAAPKAPVTEPTEDDPTVDHEPTTKE